MQPAEVVTVNVTIKGPDAVKECVGFCRVEVLGVPDKGSPKFQLHDCMPPFGCERSVNCAGWLMHKELKLEKFAIGAAALVTVFSIYAVHPENVVTVNLTICDVAVPRKVHVIFGSAGNVMGGVTDPSPKSHCQV